MVKFIKRKNFEDAFKPVPVDDVVDAIRRSHLEAVLPKLQGQDRRQAKALIQARTDLACSGCRD